MKRLERAALLSSLARELIEKGSWCGETHLQKATYLLQEVFAVPTAFDFVLYKYGPFSFDLRDEIGSMLADGLLELSPAQPYGPRLIPTDRSKQLEKQFSNIIAEYREPISFCAHRLGSLGVAELEKLATALYVTKEQAADVKAKHRAKRVRELKPHISSNDALEAISEIDQLLAQVGGEKKPVARAVR